VRAGWASRIMWFFRAEPLPQQAIPAYLAVGGFARLHREPRASIRRGKLPSRIWRPEKPVPLATDTLVSQSNFSKRQLCHFDHAGMLFAGLAQRPG